MSDQLDAYFRPATEAVDLLAPAAQAFAWTAKGSTVDSRREGTSLQVAGADLKEFGIAFVPPDRKPVDLAGLVLTLKYRAGGPALGPALLALKAKPGAPDPNLIPQVVHLTLAETGSQDITVRVPLPTTPGLAAIREVVLTQGPGSRRPIGESDDHRPPVRPPRSRPLSSINLPESGNRLARTIRRPGSSRRGG